MDRQTGGLFPKGHLARKQKYQEPQTLSSGWIKKSENGYLTRYQEDENSPNQVPNREATLDKAVSYDWASCNIIAEPVVMLRLTQL